MNKITSVACKALLIWSTLMGSQVLATEVGFGSNKSVDEDIGVVWIQVERTGDLGVVSVVWLYELWSDGRTTASHNDISYNPYSAPNSVRSYSTSGNYGWLQFDVGESLIQIPYTVSDDQKVENTERLYFELRSSSGATLGDDSLYVRIYDNDEPPPVIPILSIHNGGFVDEGGDSGSYAKLSEPTSHDVTFDVSTYYGVYQEANYSGEGGDYLGLVDKSFTIKAGRTIVDIPVFIYQNSDPNDALYERFQLRIEAGTVNSSEAYLSTDRVAITIRDVPLPEVEDFTPPVVTMFGYSSVAVAYDEGYSDSGATAYDNVDGDITDRLITGGLPIDTSVPGVHYVRYSVFDDAGNGSLVQTRTVTVSEDIVYYTNPDVVIFRDKLGAGWWDGSWEVSLNLESVAYEGFSGIEVNFTQAWSGLGFGSQGFDASSYDTLSFAVSGGPVNNGEKVFVGMHHTDGSYQYRLLIDYVEDGTLVANQWVVVHIPLSDLGVNNSLISDVVFESGGVGVFHIDELSFSNETGVCYE